MRIFLFLTLVLTCTTAKKKSKTERCADWKNTFTQCLDLGYVRRKCGDDNTNAESTKELKKLRCGKVERKLTKNCAMKCPPPPPAPVPSCSDGLQKDYRGEVNHTISGFTCMNWRQQSPHKHTRTEANYPNSGLGDHNYCRNPDDEDEGAWCYTTSPDQRWDYCGIPKCDGSVSCWDGLQKDYRGPLQVTESGERCQKWTAQSPHSHSRTPANYPGAGLGDHNYCRNPDSEEGGAWCYTTNSYQRWDYCTAPRCSDSDKYCWNGLQKTYRGPKQTTRKGKQCQKWTAQSPHKHSRTVDNYPEEGLGDHNYCRNPDNEPGGAWCYTTDSDERWDYCQVKTCEGEADIENAGKPETSK